MLGFKNEEEKLFSCEAGEVLNNFRLASAKILYAFTKVPRLSLLSNLLTSPDQVADYFDPEPTKRQTSR